MLILWIRPIHLFVTAKKSGWVRCYCHVQSGFCLKIWWTINPWAFCTICMLDLHVVALILPSTCHYTAASFMAAVRSCPRPRRRSPPWCEWVEWRDGLASGGSSMGAMRPPRQHSRPREAGAGGTTSAALGGWSKKTRGWRSTMAVGWTSYGHWS
jgi:hypothetical protein